MKLTARKEFCYIESVLSVKENMKFIAISQDSWAHIPLYSLFLPLRVPRSMKSEMKMEISM